MNGQPSTVIPRWQGVIVVLSLVVLTAVLLLPLASVLLGLWGVVLALVSAWLLDAVGVRGDAALKEAVAIAVALLGSAGGIALVGAIATGIRNLSAAWKKKPSSYSYAPQIPVSNVRKSWWSRMLEHPWWSLGGIALLVDGCVVPFQAAKATSFPPELLGGFILTGATLLFVSALVLSWRANVYGMRTLWAGVRRSGFLAGLVTAGSLGLSIVALLAGQAFGQVASELSAPETTRALEACGSSTDCSTRVLQSALQGKPRNLSKLPAEQFTPEERASFDQCIDELHSKDMSGNSPRDRGYLQARLMTRNDMIAEDIVQNALLSVCLSSHRIREIAPYFIRAVQNGARRESRRNRRSCHVDYPQWPVNQCILDSIEAWSNTAWMEASANDAFCLLTVEERQVVELHVIDGLSHAQIARRLGTTEPAARQRYHRARQRLQEKFNERCR